MNKDQALNLIKQVIEGYRGTFQEHIALQEAFSIVKKELETKIEQDEQQS